MPIAQPEIKYEISEQPGGALKISLDGRMDSKTLGRFWSELTGLIQEKKAKELVIDAEDVSYCDGAGVGLLLECIKLQNDRQGTCVVQNLQSESKKLLDSFLQQGQPFQIKQYPQENVNPVELLGKSFVALKKGLYDQFAFSGELAVHLFTGFKNPSKYFRWTDIWLIVQKSGIDAVPIILLINFLMGLIMAFQAAIPMRQFGADVYVADLVSLSILRVLGPLMTAIIIAGRTGSAFAAEIGTMKVNEEINALYTMGINPVRFLVTNRVLAVIILMPVLTLLADLAGLLGGAVVFKSFGYPAITYIKQVVNAIRINDFMGGFVKSFVFGFLIAAVGCLRGIQTKNGASAVGQSATSAVVSSLILIIVTEGTFAVIYYFLGI